MSDGPVPTSVYAGRGHGGELLYVGLAVDPARRWREHERHQPWADEIAHWEVLHWLDSWAEALDIEYYLIVSAQPKHNKLGKRDGTAP